MSFIGTVMILLSLILSIATPLLVKGLNDYTEENVQVLGAAANSWAEWATSGSAFSTTAYWLECLFIAISVATTAVTLTHAATLYSCLAIYFTGTEETLSFLLNYAKEFAKIIAAAVHAIMSLMLGLVFLTARTNHAAGICMVVGLVLYVKIARGLFSLVTKLALDQHASSVLLFEKAEGGGDAELALGSPV